MRRENKWFFMAIWGNRSLIKRMSWREIAGRYRGSFLGIGWSAMQPLIMLFIYTVVFSGLLRSRWGGEELSETEFAANLFAGLIVFNLFAECTARAPMLVVSVPNYVKKVIFPVEILSAISVLTAAFHAIIGLTILMCAFVILGIPISGQVTLIPFVWMPLVLGNLSVSWLLSALGVYIRDLEQLVGSAINMLLFVSAVFYPISALPSKWQTIITLNPLVHTIEDTRMILIEGKAPSLAWPAIGLVVALVACQLSYRVFSKMKRGFADVI
jgi:lipopolysaccharide transport system permease protein